MKIRLLPLLAVVALFACSSCTNVSKIITSGLRIEVTKVARAKDGTVRVTWRVRNPNVVPYLVDHAAHKLTLDGTPVGVVKSETRVAVPRDSFAEQTDVLTAEKGAEGRIAELAGKGTAAYRLDSTIWILIVDDDLDKSVLQSAGEVPVVAE